MLEFTQRANLVDRGRSFLDSLLTHSPMVIRRIFSDRRMVEWDRSRGRVVRRSCRADRPFPVEALRCFAYSLGVGVSL